jgi:hypothetical protein
VGVVKHLPTFSECAANTGLKELKLRHSDQELQKLTANQTSLVFYLPTLKDNCAYKQEVDVCYFEAIVHNLYHFTKSGQLDGAYERESLAVNLNVNKNVF